VLEVGANLGNLSETFIMNKLSNKYVISSIKKEDKNNKKTQKGDLLVDNKLVFEVGGKSKAFKQIEYTPNCFLLADYELTGAGNRIPLWLFGFLS
jgi:uncharacterized protein